MKNTMMKKFTVSAILAAMLTGMVACGSEPTPVTPSDDTTTEPEVTTEAFPLTKKDYGGMDYNMYLWTKTQIGLTEETGDVISDANFRRNRKVEELYNLKFKYDLRDGGVADYATWLSTLNSSIMAGDDAIQLAGGYAYRMSRDTINNGFLNLRETSIDFTKPWWPSNILEASDLGGKIYLVYGNIDTNYYDVTYALYFNKKLSKEYNTENIYDLVNSGKWTIDKLIGMVKDGARDLDGNSVMDENDRYGYLTDYNMCIDAFIHACDVKISEMGNDSMPKLLGLTEKYVNVQNKIRDFVLDKTVTFYGVRETANEMFMNGNGFILSARIFDAHAMRAMNEDFGIVPYPKWDEKQDKYYTYNALGNSTGFCVPITTDPELAGYVLEALAYYGYQDVLPEYYERALKGKVSRDDDSASMLDIIFNNIVFDFTEVYSYCFGDQKAPSMLLRMSLKNNQEMASMYAADENLYNSTMADLIEKLK